MTDTTKAQILDLARKAINTEMLALKHMKETLGDNFADAVELILACSGKCIVTGMGKSGLVGRKIAATLASTGTPSFFLHPGEAFHGDLGMISKDDVVLALSYSGETDEILKIVPFIHSNGNKLVSMTGNPESALAKNSDIHLDVSVEEEASSCTSRRRPRPRRRSPWAMRWPCRSCRCGALRASISHACIRAAASGGAC